MYHAYAYVCPCTAVQRDIVLISGVTRMLTEVARPWIADSLPVNAKFQLNRLITFAVILQCNELT